MKYKFNFIQIANWLFICRDNLLKVKEQAIENKISKEEAIQKLESQKRHAGNKRTPKRIGKVKWH